MEIPDVKKTFPALHNNSVVYLDNAATTQMPQAVIDAMTMYASHGRGNPHRGLHAFAARATEQLQSSRQTVASFIGASVDDLLFTKGTTEGLNLLARALGGQLGPGDEVVLTIFEHHANLLPWRKLAEERGFSLKYLPMAADGGVDLELAQKIIGPKTRVVAILHASNVLGTILPVRELARLAHAVNAWYLVDAAQTVARMPVDVVSLECDAFAFGAHKMYGPEGIGALYVAKTLRPHLQPLLFGGGMVDEVLDDTIRYAEDVRLFEAGSPNVSGAVGFATACDFLMQLNLTEVRSHELALVETLLAGLQQLDRVKIYGQTSIDQSLGVVSFSVDGIHSHDVAQILADHGVAVRAGYHCAAPLTRCLDLGGTVRVSFGVYNTIDDVERLLAALKIVLQRFV